MEFRFIVSGDFVIYEVWDWGKPWHEKRIVFFTKAPFLYCEDGHKRLNYTSKEYERDDGFGCLSSSC